MICGGLCGGQKYFQIIPNGHMGFTFKEDLKTLVHVLLPIDFPPPLKQIVLQYSGHLFIGRGALTWTLFN